VPVLTLSAVLVLAPSAQAQEEDGPDPFWDAFRDAAAFAAALFDRFVPGATGHGALPAAPASPTRPPSGQKPETLDGRHPARADAGAQVDALLNSAGLVPAATPEVARRPDGTSDLHGRFPPGALTDPVDEWLQRCTTGLSQPVPPGCTDVIRDERPLGELAEQGKVLRPPGPCDLDPGTCGGGIRRPGGQAGCLTDPSRCPSMMTVSGWLGGSMAQLDQLWGRRPGPEPVVGDARPFQLPELTDPDLFGRGCGSLC
jgi:hypothetical protein